MTIEIKIQGSVPPAEMKELGGWGDDVFGVAPLDLEWRPKELHFVLYEDGRPRSHASILKHWVDLDEGSLLLGGLGTVVTVPGSQKRGFGQRVVRRAVRYLEETWEVDFGVLFCLERLVAFYQAQGWRRAEHGLIVDQPSGKVDSPTAVMVLPLSDKKWPEHVFELGSLPW